MTQWFKRDSQRVSCGTMRSSFLRYSLACFATLSSEPVSKTWGLANVHPVPERYSWCVYSSNYRAIAITSIFCKTVCVVACIEQPTPRVSRN